MTDADTAYFRMRLTQEEQAIAAANTAAIAALHRQMAEAYRTRLGDTASAARPMALDGAT